MRRYRDGTPFPLGIPGFTYADLYDPARLADLAAGFYRYAEAGHPEAWARFKPYRDQKGEGFSPVEVSRILVEMAPILGRFLERLFQVEEEAGRLRQSHLRHERLFEFKKLFVTRRALKKAAQTHWTLDGFLGLEAQVRTLNATGFAPADTVADLEMAAAETVMALLALEKALNPKTAAEPPESALEGAARLRSATFAHDNLRVLAAGLPEDPRAGGFEIVGRVLAVYENWLVAGRRHAADGRAREWAIYQQPHALEFEELVELKRPHKNRPEHIMGLPETQRRRDGFKLTDARYSERLALSHADYCVYCHERDRDSCSKGFREKAGGFQKNPLGYELRGCPLDEKIGEMNLLKLRGENIGALAVVCVDNPMLPGTGHRICNDCMKACIYQKQDPVDIPQIETRVLTDVLELPYGFEIWSLLARFNPLNVKTPHERPYNGKNVLVVGQGPAGYTLAHHLLNEGFGIVAIDGLKIEPLDARLTGDSEFLPMPVKSISLLREELDERILLGFGGVSEYGITVRWDKNFLGMIYLALSRRDKMRVYGGVRFGGTITADDAWDMGFDHIAFATGAGKPTIVNMKNNLLRGIRKASDFLMALQLTGAAKKSSLANLQVQLPAIVIGGGLTGIDTATELIAYYVTQVEKIVRRHDALVAAHGAEATHTGYNAEELALLDTYLEHGHAVLAERRRAAAAGEMPNFVPLVQAWGGVHMYYRKRLIDSPAYRLNHEEVIKALEEGIGFVECMNPVEAVPGETGALKAVKFEKQEYVDGKWKNSGEIIEVPCRSMFIAAGTKPNSVYEREFPGSFKLDKWGEFFEAYTATRAPGGAWTLAPSGDRENPGFFTSYQKNGKFISFYGDNHPKYAGNVVKAMASAKDGFRHVVELFQPEIGSLAPAGQPEREARWYELARRLDDGLIATVVRVDRLTPTIIEVVVRAPLAARKFKPGQFYRLQNFESLAPRIGDTTLAMEGVALTGAWTDPGKGLLSMIVLEMGASSRLCAALRPGERVIVMGPTGTPTHIPRGETVVLAGGGLGNAVLFSIGRALKENGNRVIYFAGYRDSRDLFKRREIESSADVVVWARDAGPEIPPERPQDKTFAGNIVQAMLAYAQGELGPVPVPFSDTNRIIAIGSDRMMAAVAAARHRQLKPFLNAGHMAIGSINSPMQCMMKEICAQCLQRHTDPETGKEFFVFSCFNQDQELDRVDFQNLNERLKINSVMEKLSNSWLDHLLATHPVPMV